MASLGSLGCRGAELGRHGFVEVGTKANMVLVGISVEELAVLAPGSRDVLVVAMFDGVCRLAYLDPRELRVHSGADAVRHLDDVDVPHRDVAHDGEPFGVQLFG